MLLVDAVFILSTPLMVSFLKAASGKEELEVFFSFSFWFFFICLLIDFWMFEFGEALRQGLSRERLLLMHFVGLQATSASWVWEDTGPAGVVSLGSSLLPGSVLNCLAWGTPHAPQSPCPGKNQVPMGGGSGAPQGRAFVERLELSHAWNSRREAVAGLLLTPC